MTVRAVVAAAVVLGAMGPAVMAVAQELPRETRQPWQVAGTFPLSEPGPLERQAKPITPENPIPRRISVVHPLYPPEAAAVGARATVTLRVTLNVVGRVGEVRTVGVPVLGAMTVSGAEPRTYQTALEALVQSAKNAVAQWIYDAPSNSPVSFDVVLAFSPERDPEIVVHGTTVKDPLPVPTAASLVPIQPPSGAVPAWAEGVPRVGSALRPPTKVKHVNPVYPQEARDARVAGVVILEVRVEADGRVGNARVLRSIPLLDEAALAAVTQWEFTPTLLDGVPTPIVMTVTVQFSLS